MNWIDVKKELPINDTKCIVWIKDKKNHLEYFNEVIFNSDYFNVKNDRFIYYENGGEYETDYTENVTHWLIPTNPRIF